MRNLKIHSLQSGWCDKDEILLHACFQCLVDFIEKEPLHSTDWNSDNAHKFARKEMNTLYKWWKKRSKKISNPNHIKEYSKDNEYLKRLITIRKFLWT
jgi:hypothetical protein